MREVAFRAFLQFDLNDDSGRSYVSYLNRVEQALHLDLDELRLQGDEIAQLKKRMIAAGVPAKSVSNCGSALNAYARFAEGTAASEAVNVASSRSRIHVVRQADTRGLMRIYGEVLDELRDRGVLRTGNGPIGDYAEQLFAVSFGWELTGNSQSGHDAVANGLRYQIKSRRITSRNRSRQLSALRKLPDRPFDILAAVLFDQDFEVMRAALIPYEVVVSRAKRTEHTNSWRFMLADSVWSLPGVEDVTDRLRIAMAGHLPEQPKI